MVCGLSAGIGSLLQSLVQTVRDGFMGNDRVYCSDLCLASGEPMLGTATQVDVWLLLEYKPVWRAKAVEDNELATATKDWIDRAVSAVAAKGGKARVQFIRRPELDSALITLFVAESGTLRRFQSEGYAEIQHIDIDAAKMDEVHDPQYFVCTNGQRDLCCARYGLPVYTELRNLVGERAWQTTHVGGHRFRAERPDATPGRDLRAGVRG